METTIYCWVIPIWNNISAPTQSHLEVKMICTSEYVKNGVSVYAGVCKGMQKMVW